MKRPFIWAHRGASCCAPENTMAAFTAAVESGADGLELDIHLSSDGIPVVIHDETLERTTDACGPVAGMTLQRLQHLDAGSWFSPEFAGEPIPELAEVMRAFSGCVRLNLELKELRAGLVVLELLGQYPAADVVISSFNHGLLQRLRTMDSHLPLASLFDAGLWRDAVQAARALSASAFHPVVQQVNRPMITVCMQAGLPVSVWTVDDVGVARSLVRAGVSGFFTNDPATLNAAFAPLEKLPA